MPREWRDWPYGKKRRGAVVKEYGGAAAGRQVDSRRSEPGSAESIREILPQAIFKKHPGRSSDVAWVRNVAGGVARAGGAKHRIGRGRRFKHEKRIPVRRIATADGADDARLQDLPIEPDHPARAQVGRARQEVRIAWRCG